MQHPNYFNINELVRADNFYRVKSSQIVHKLLNCCMLSNEYILKQINDAIAAK